MHITCLSAFDSVLFWAGKGQLANGKEPVYITANGFLLKVRK